jgi:hypothetical protein
MCARDLALSSAFGGWLDALIGADVTERDFDGGWMGVDVELGAYFSERIVGGKVGASINGAGTY